MKENFFTRKVRGVSYSEIFVIAIPMLLSNATETINMFVDRRFLTELGPEYLSASMSGGLTSYALLSFFLGVIAFVNPLVAQFYGAKEINKCAQATGQGFYLVLLFLPFMLFIIPLVKMFFNSIGHTPLQVELEFTYFRIVFLGSVAFLARMVLTGFFLGIGKTRLVLLANAIAMLVNIPANYLLIFGKFGFPELKMAGAAIGTVLGSTTSLIILLVAYLSKTYHKKYGTRNRESWTFQKPLFKKLFRFGLPSGVEQFLVVLAFDLFLQFMHTFGVNVSAAITIAFNWDLVSFLPMIGIGAATSSLVGQRLGAENKKEAREVANRAFQICLTYALVLSLIFVIFAHPMVAFFAKDFDKSADIARMAVVFLRLAALYLIGDAVAIIYISSLKATGDTKFVMRVAVLCNIFFHGLNVLLINTTNISPYMCWIIFVSLIIVQATIMFIRFKGDKWEKIEVIDHNH